jgi:hypothetical protein
LVADHLLHFSRATLGYLAARCGLRPATLRNDVVSKEITLLGQRGHSEIALPDAGAGARIVRQSLAWLEQVVLMTRAAAHAGPIGIFGTAIAGMALYGDVKDRVVCFVDEDPHRIGRQYDGKPVLAPANVPKGVPVILALPPAQARPLAARCAQAGVTCLVPPDLPTALRVP